MIVINKIIDIDGLSIYVKVIIEGKRVEIIWDKHIPPSLVKRLLLLVTSLIASALPGDKSSVEHRRRVVKVYEVHYPEDDYVLDRESMEKLRA